MKRAAAEGDRDGPAHRWMRELVVRLVGEVCADFERDRAVFAPFSASEARPLTAQRRLSEVVALAYGPEAAAERVVHGKAAEEGDHGDLRQRSVVERDAGVVQPRVYRQRSEGPCGYHAVHNALRAVAAVTAPDDAAAAKVWRGTATATSYYAVYASARRHCGAPADDVVERGPMQDLVARWPRARPFAEAGTLSAVSELTLEAAAPLEAAMRAARAGSPGVHALVVGAVNHWIAVVVARGEVAVLDSYNRPSLCVRLDRARAYAAAHPELVGKPVRQMYYIESRRRVAAWVALATEAARAGTDIRAVYLQRQTADMVRTFRRMTAAARDDDDAEPLPSLDAELRFLRARAASGAPSPAPGLRAWLSDYYPPALLVRRDAARIAEIGAGHLGAGPREALALWAAEVRRAAAKEGGDELLARAAAAAGALEAAAAGEG